MHNQSKCQALLTGGRASIVFLAIWLAGVSGCGGTYGRLVLNPEVKASFERDEVLPGYRYFHSGMAPHPRVIIGLREDYTLESDYWHPVEMTPELLRQWLRLREVHPESFPGNNGSDILDARGRKIGVWYGLKDARDWGAVKMIGDKTVDIVLVERRARRVIPLTMWTHYED
jgi:hypothetical protein